MKTWTVKKDIGRPDLSVDAYMDSIEWRDRIIVVGKGRSSWLRWSIHLEWLEHENGD